MRPLNEREKRAGSQIAWRIQGNTLYADTAKSANAEYSFGMYCSCTSRG